MRVMVSAEQVAVCARYGVEPVPSREDEKIGLGLHRGGGPPIHGLRHLPEGDNCGWYIWRGELTDDADFFDASHVAHLGDHAPEVLPYLALPPGWRFLIAPDHQNVWFDAQLLDE
jgi:hypothetical protein